MLETEPGEQDQDRALTRFLADDYADNLAEGHRRHPTQFAGPFVTAHISLLHPGPFAHYFEDYMRAVLGFLLDPHSRRPMFNWPQMLDPASLARDLKRLFSFDTQKISNELLLYELEDLRFEPIDGQPSVVWRMEVNREYLSFTLFSRLKFEREDGSLLISMMPRDAAGRGPAYRVPFDPAPPPDTTECPPSRYCEDVSRVLCRAMGDHVEALFKPLLDGAIAPWAGQSIGRAEFRPPAIFARFTGPVVPWTVYGPGLQPISVADPDIWCAWRGLPHTSEAQIRRSTHAREGQRIEKCVDGRPFFPRFRERSIDSATPDLNWALTCTNTFLSRIWPGLEGHLLNGSQEDSVACYLQHGHSLYISALGGRASPNDSSPSRYMILYDDPVGADLKGPAAQSTSHNSIDCTRRISRIVGRMHDLGVARLAALSGQATMKGFAQYLRSIENRLQALEPELLPGAISRDLHSLHDELYKYLRAQRIPLHYSSTRTAYHLNVLDDLVADLNVVQIPGRQPYDRFIKRRFRAGLVYLTGIGDRLQRVTAEISRRLQMEILREQSAHTRLAALSANKIVELQATADFFVRVLAFYYIPLIIYYIFNNVSKLVKLWIAELSRLDITYFGSYASLLPVKSLAHYTTFAFAMLPPIAFLATIMVLRAHLSVGLVRDLVVFSKNPKEGSALLRLAKPFINRKQYETGLNEGRDRFAKAEAEQKERDRIAAWGQPLVPPAPTD